MEKNWGDTPSATLTTPPNFTEVGKSGCVEAYLMCP